MSRLSAKAGFTVVELIVVITVMGVLSTLIYYTLWNYYDSNVTSLGITTQDTDTRSSLRQIDRDVSSSIAFSDTVSVPLGFGPTLTSLSWSYNSDPNKMNLITSSYATTPSTAPTPGMVLYNKNILGACNNDPLSDTISTYSSIYFVGPNQSTGQDSLYRRTVVDPTVCSSQGIAQKTTCASTTSRILYPSCETTDALIVDNVKSFKLRFFQNPTDTTPVTGSAIQGASTVEITVNTQPPTAKIPASTAVVRINLAKI